MSNTTAYIKIGDNFDVPIQLVDTVTGEGVTITNGMTITSKIVNLSGEVIAEPSFTPYPNQTADKGFILMSVPSSVTSTWTKGKSKMDIKFVVNSSVRHSQDFSFYIIEAIT